MSKGDVSGRLSGYYRDTKLPAYLKVEEDRVSWHEGGRKTLDRINIEYADLQQAEGIVREVTGIQNYRKKLSKEEEEISYRDSEMLCSDISRERKRIGGDWAIAGVLLRKKDRDICRWRYRIFLSIKE